MHERPRGSAVEPLLQEAAAAEILGVSPRTLADWRRRGVGPAFARVGRRLVRYARRDIEAFVAAGRAEARHAP